MSKRHRQTINIRQLATKTVTIYPDKAEIVREINNIKLNACFNEVNIIGFTPITDANSIRIEAGASCRVVDTEVELIDNPENFDDVFPSDFSDSSDDETDVFAESTYVSPEVESLEKEIAELQQESDDFQEIMDSNKSSMKILESSLERLGSDDLSMINASLSVYQKQRSALYAASASARTSKRTVDNKISVLEKRKTVLEDKYRRHSLKKKAYRRDVLAETRKANLIEGAKFWPVKVYKIKLVIDVAVLTPRSIVSSLLLRYIVNGVSWSLNYDLSISSNGGGTLRSQAEIQNTTSETWKNAKITLSTAQVQFSGFQEPVPDLKPWSLSLVDNTGLLAKSPADTAHPVLSYQEEISTSIRREESQNDSGSIVNSTVFGNSSNTSINNENLTLDFTALLHNADRLSSANTSTTANRESTVIAATDKTTNDHSITNGGTQNGPGNQNGEPMRLELRGLRTIEPSSMKRRLNISIEELETSLAHIVVPKLRVDAFKVARITNTSAMTILEGSASLILNGDQIGHTYVPYCAMGESFEIVLGIDPAIKVEYRAPSRPKHTGVFGDVDLTKKRFATFTRTVVLTNTHTASSTEAAPRIIVEDQIPITQDKRLTIDVLMPKGLQVGGKSVPAGEAAFSSTTSKPDTESNDGVTKSDTQDDDQTSKSHVQPSQNWGSASARLDGKGSVFWKVNLKPGKAVQLKLSYKLWHPVTVDVLESMFGAYWLNQATPST